MNERHRARGPKPLKANTLDELCPEFAESIDRIMAAPGANGWARLCELLHFAQRDPLIKKSPGASAFLELMHDLASKSFHTKTETGTESEGRLS
jgi:hypothetical protein